MGATKFTKKLTLRNVGLDAQTVENVAVEKKAETPVCRVYGKANALYKKGQTTFGPYTEFSGEFEAINLVTGQKYRSKNLILPEVGEMALLGLIGEVITGKKTEEIKVTFVRFGLDITAVENENSKKGWKFKFGVQPLVEPKGDDELTLLAKEFGAPPLLLTKEESPKTGKK